MFTSKDDGVMIFQEEEYSSFLKREVCTQHPFIRGYFDDENWLAFFEEKYMLMTRESLTVALRNTTR